MSKKPFTADEVRVVLKWAVAYLDSPTHSEHFEKGRVIGSDTMFPNELLSLVSKTREATPEVILGMLNTAFLLGFSACDSQYPLQEVWDSLDIVLGAEWDEGTRLSLNKLGDYLSKAGLIKPVE